jgi:hypothetical protein
MSSERKIDPFSALILVISVIGIIMVAALLFAGFYLPGYGNRFACFGCEYSTGGDAAARIIMIILLIAQIVLAINELLPEKFINIEFINVNLLGMILSGLTILFAFIGLGAFGINYGAIDGFEWWPEAGFYGGAIAGIINVILFTLKFLNKI